MKRLALILAVVAAASFAGCTETRVISDHSIAAQFTELQSHAGGGYVIDTPQLRKERIAAAEAARQRHDQTPVPIVPLSNPFAGNNVHWSTNFHVDDPANKAVTEQDAPPVMGRLVPAEPSAAAPTPAQSPPSPAGSLMLPGMSLPSPATGNAAGVMPPMLTPPAGMPAEAPAPVAGQAPQTPAPAAPAAPPAPTVPPG